MPEGIPSDILPYYASRVILQNIELQLAIHHIQQDFPVIL